MNTPNYADTICDIIDSQQFKDKLIQINNNYSNLKQESFIRNTVLEELNNIFSNDSLTIKAFAEHPRINGSRVDLSIIESNDLENPFKIEFKFQFSNDGMINYHRVIQKDFIDRKSDLFILIIADWNIAVKKKYDKEWGITSNLSRYVSKNDQWKEDLRKSFKQFENGELIEFEKLEINLPYNTEYYFYILKRK